MIRLRPRWTARTGRKKTWVGQLELKLLFVVVVAVDVEVDALVRCSNSRGSWFTKKSKEVPCSRGSWVLGQGARERDPGG